MSCNAAGRGRREVAALIRFSYCGCFSTPPSCGHFSYILHYKTQGRRTEMSRNAIEYEREGGAPLFLTALFLAELV